MAIPIENIYYLLCYAWNKLDERDRVKVSTEDCSTLLDLFAKVLINSTRILLKRGIDRNYVPITTEFAGVKGKLELSATLKTDLLLRQRTICSFDEFSSNIMTNRILLSTLRDLLRTRGLDAGFKKDIKDLVWRFGDVEPLELTRAHFAAVKLHRNNKFYDFVLRVCRIVFENRLLSERTGEFEFQDFVRDERKMSGLFEEFVRRFYEIEQDEFRVGREDIYWQLQGPDRALLPKMQTDVTLRSAREKIIIETKFYADPLKGSYDSEKLPAANLYQLFSYLLNQRVDERSMRTTGILLYARTDRDIDLDYEYEGHRFLVRTVNLAAGWKEIEERLRAIVGTG
ncbi:MAG: restriction endonuclease [Acidobacteria bacterium]|nr:restriction endonuclease [Acidobacteriota bacterium]